jgi:hypothetical protein
VRLLKLPRLEKERIEREVAEAARFERRRELSVRLLKLLD